MSDSQESDSQKLTALSQEESKLAELQVEEVVAAERALANAHATARDSWEKASRIVRDYKPVSPYLWRIVHAVLGKPEKIGKPDPIMFDAMRKLVQLAARDPKLGAKKEERMTLDVAVKAIGYDTAAALCVLHGVCRRISTTLIERIWVPIIDDALLRAQIGSQIGGYCPAFGKGRGLLAGFCGRAGLAVQIAAADMTRAQRALESLAAGMDIRVAGLSIYGCDPLQVSAMMLASAGVSAEAAFGVAGFSENGRGITPKTPSYLWLSTFSATEYLRMDEEKRIDERYWRALGINDATRAEIRTDVQKILRKGHGWDWLCQSQAADEEDEDEG